MRMERIGKRAAAMVMAIIAAAVLVSVTTQASAQAAPSVATGAAARTPAWTPQISPLYSGEWVQRNVSNGDRNSTLALCAVANGIACVSAGEGDGEHSVFHLFRCETRSLSNFIDALAVVNHQTGGAQVHFWGPNYQVYIPADNAGHTVADYATYDFTNVDLC